MVSRNSGAMVEAEAPEIHEAPTDGPEAPEIPEAPTGDPEVVESLPNGFVSLSDLSIVTKRDPYESLKALLGTRIALLGLTDDLKAATVLPISLVIVAENGSWTSESPPISITLPRGAGKVLAAAMVKANGKIVAVTPVQKKRGIGFE